MNPNATPTVKLELTGEEFNFLRAVLGDLPTKSNAWVLLNNLERQAQAQPQEQAPQPAPLNEDVEATQA